MTYLLIALAAALGALSRHALDRAVVAALGPTTLGIFAVNITGSFLLGLLITASDANQWPAAARLAIAVGFLGSYTTFSTLTVASVQMADSGEPARAALNVVGSVAVGLLAAFLGIIAGRALWT